MKQFLYFMISTMTILAFTACSDSPVEPETTENPITFSSEEEMEMVAADISAETGGVMSDIQTASAAADSNFYSAKTSLDTSLSYQWIDYDIDLSFYLANGSAVPVYVSAVDSIVYQGSLSGDTAYAAVNLPNSEWQLTLNRNSGLTISNILSDTLRINGSSNNNSVRGYNGNRIDYTIETGGVLTINDVIMPLTGNNFIPISGTIDGTIAGTIAERNSQVKHPYEIPYTVTFEGNANVTVALPNRGITFTVNLLSGEINR